jgi:hypothetical protein
MKNIIRVLSLLLCATFLAVTFNVNVFATEAEGENGTEETVLMGDLNGDGVIDTNDSILALNMVANIIPADLTVADMDGDGFVSVRDARAILRLALYPPKPKPEPDTPQNPEGGEQVGGVVIPDKNGENKLSDKSDNTYIQLIAQRFNVDPASLVAIYSEPDTGTNYVLQFKKSGGKYEKSVDNLQRVYHIGAAPEREISYTNGKLLFGEHYNCDSGTGVLVFNLVQTQVMPQYPDYFSGV